MSNQFLIRSVSARPGERPVLGEPIVGRWYAGMTVYTDERNGDSTERAGELARYEGEGCWSSDPADDCDDDLIDMGDYDYLQEQV